jgi:DNA-binding NarL/FixJ family response regulator
VIGMAEIGESAEVIVHGELPVVTDGIAALLRRSRVPVSVRTSGDVEQLVTLLRQGRAQVAVLCLSASRPASHRRLLEAVANVAGSSGRRVAAVCVVSAPGGTFAPQVSAVVPTSASAAVLTRAVLAAGDGSSPSTSAASSETARPRGGRVAGHDLTNRELEVLRGLVDGLPTTEIAGRLGMSVNTVRTHVQRLLGKLGAHTRLQAAAIAVDERLV